MSVIGFMKRRPSSPSGRIKGRYQYSPKPEVYFYALLTHDPSYLADNRNNYLTLNVAGFES
jgi:hypothetical protein